MTWGQMLRACPAKLPIPPNTREGLLEWSTETADTCRHPINQSREALAPLDVTTTRRSLLVSKAGGRGSGRLQGSRRRLLQSHLEEACLEPRLLGLLMRSTWTASPGRSLGCLSGSPGCNDRAWCRVLAADHAKDPSPQEPIEVCVSTILVTWPHQGVHRQGIETNKWHHNSPYLRTARATPANSERHQDMNGIILW